MGKLICLYALVIFCYSTQVQLKTVSQIINYVIFKTGKNEFATRKIDV